MVDLPHPPVSAVDGKSDTIPSQLATTLGASPLKCCCGSLECVFLRHNNAILDNVEKDVHQAARMGQVSPAHLRIFISFFDSSAFAQHLTLLCCASTALGRHANDPLHAF